METKSDTSKKKNLKHVKVYDRIYEQIQNGTYPVGSQLPSELTLADLMDVSRMTLRKALALLVEDGLVKNVPGVGHFICTPDHEKRENLDMSSFHHPIHSYCTTVPDSTEFEFRMEPPTHSILDTLNQYTPAVIIADRWYKRDNMPFAYSLSFLPIECIARKQLDLTVSEKLLAYLEDTCYQEMTSCSRICSHSTSGNFSSKKYSISNHDSFLLIQETICDEAGKILISSKHYIPSELFRIEIRV